MGRAVKVGILVWFFGLLVLPVLLFAAGVRPANVENRTLAGVPPHALRDLAKISTYRQGALAFADRMPLRDRVIEQRARVASELLGDDPTSEVLKGKDGWLFLSYEVAICDVVPVTPHQAALGVDLLRAILNTTGRELRTTVVPSKTFIEREHYGRIRGGDACVKEREEQLEAELRAVPGFIDLWTPFRAAKEAGLDVFYPHDSHAGPVGALAFAEALVRSLDPAAWTSAVMGLGPDQPRPGDLANLSGQPEDVPAPTLAITQAPTAPITTPAVAIGDSQLKEDLYAIGPFFPGLTFCHDDQYVSTGCDPAQLKAARLWIVETVARFSFERAVALATPALNALGDELPWQPATWAEPVGATIGADGTLNATGPFGTAIAPAADDPSHHRVLRVLATHADQPITFALTHADGSPIAGSLVGALVPAGTPGYLAIPPGLPIADVRLQAAGAGAVQLAPPAIVDVGPGLGG